MKKIILTLAMLYASSSIADEITKDQYIQILSDNKSAYENVSPGMAATYIHYASININGSIQSCNFLEKRIVVSSNSPEKYLVYKKQTYLNDCGGVFRPTFSQEFLVEKRLLPFDDRLSAVQDFDENTKFDFSENVVSIIWSKNDKKWTHDVSRSQFYDLVHQVKGSESSKLLSRDLIDPSTLNLSDLPIFEN
jgi:hypothetical protein